MYDGFRADWMDDEQNMVRESVERFCDQEVDPFYESWEKDGNVPRALWHKLGEAGFLNCDVAEADGGFGADYRMFATVIETFSRRGFATIAGTMIGVHSGIVAHYIAHHGTPAQKTRYLPAMTTGEVVGALALTEPGAGSDLQGIKARAVRDGDGWVLNGQKTFISNGQHCDVSVVAARTDTTVAGANGTSLFLVDADAPGFSRGRNLEKIGMHSADTSEMYFQDLRLSDDALLGPLNGGFAVMMAELPRERLMLANVAIAACEGMLARTMAYAGERSLFGRTLTAFQTARHRFAEMLTETAVCRAYIDQCVRRLIAGELDTVAASMAKLSATETQGRVADQCLQLHGGYGYMTEYPIARDFVDARVQRIYGGASEIMKEIIAKGVLGR